MVKKLFLKNLLVPISLVLVLLSGIPVSAEADPIIVLKPSAVDMGVGSTFTVQVLVQSDVAVNAFDLTLNYDPNIFEFNSFNTAHSIIDFWHSSPKVLAPGTIKLEGGSTRPFSGASGEIASIEFHTKAEGSATIALSNAQVYLADGKGTAVSSYASYLMLAIASSSPIVSVAEIKDETQPVLYAQVEKNPYDSAPLVVFQAIDKESGVQSVLMRSRAWISWDDWKPVSNPVALAGGVWALELKAVDNYGNQTVETMYIWNALIKKVLYILLGAVLMLGAYYAIRVYPVRSKKFQIKN